MNAEDLNVDEMPRASVAEDGSLIQLVFKGPTGKVTLNFRADKFEQFASRAIQLFTHARNQKLTTGDHLEILPVPAVAAMAQAPVGGSKVIVSFRADNGVPYSFAIDPDESKQLRPQLRTAEESARRQGSQTRQ